ncbi:membrane protein [Mycobacterium frederiksbergense]|uniref:Membrane protein n=1 Tax=Mycolicibacterium frederiksbergense TaxID=117567 RepID=A0ABT6L3X2_9MYCO|nr:inner membrane protein YhjD [Mycolicibacterium frederiksbergense]MDH6196907.1 membrane protein [Mycolicibacterium frederiksbergense]
MSDEEKPGFLARVRARFPWFDHVMLAQERYNDCNGNFYAAGITYFTIFALFPLLMVGFAAGGFLLSRRPDLLDEIERRIRTAVSGDFGQQLVQLMDSAIASRGTVGIIGLATAAWAGLGWMANLREALSRMWQQPKNESGFVGTKVSDLLALVSGFLAMVITIGLTVLGDPALMRRVLHWLGIGDMAGVGFGLRVVSLLVSVTISWVIFTWIISRLPREPVKFRSSMQAGLIAAVGFEIFKQVASLYLQSVMTGPAGATFGPVLGLMVFAYITARLILYATAWAATSKESLAAAPVEPPHPAQITTRVQVREGVGVSGVLAAAAAGALGALGLSRLLRR